MNESEFTTSLNCFNNCHLSNINFSYAHTVKIVANLNPNKDHGYNKTIIRIQWYHLQTIRKFSKNVLILKFSVDMEKKQSSCLDKKGELENP